MTMALHSTPTAVSTLATKRSLIENISDPSLGTRWNEFDQIYRRVVLGMARGSGLTLQDAQDVTQDVFRDLCRGLVGFKLGERRGSFRNFLFRLVRWRITSRFRQLKTHSTTSLDAEDSTVGELAAPESAPGMTEAEFQEALTRAMEVLGREMKARDLQILELYYCAGWPAQRIAKALKMPVATVYVVAHRQKRRLAREILKRL